VKKTSSLIFRHITWRGAYFLSVLLINILIARFFAAAKTGQIFYAINNLSLILLLVGCCLESGSAYYLSSGKISGTAIARFCIVWSACASLPAIAIWWIITQYFHRMDMADPQMLFASVFFIPGVLLTTYFTALFYARQEFVVPNKILLLVNIALIISFIAGRNRELVNKYLVGIYFFGFFVQGCLLMIFYFRGTKEIQEFFFPPAITIKKVIRYSLMALLANSLYFLVNRIDYWFVAYYCSAADLGNYIQASKLGQILLILPSILGSTLFPIMASTGKSGHAPNLAAVMRILFWLNGIICIVVICTGWYLFPLIFGRTFNEMYLLFVLLIPGILSFTLNYPLAAWFSAGNRIRINIWAAVVALAVILPGDIFLIPRYGVWMAAFVSSAGYFSYYVYSLYQYRKEYNGSLKSLMLIRKSDITGILESYRTKIVSGTIETPTLIN
jgi:O-antigen/teichoic acid export membrane protein